MALQAAAALLVAAYGGDSPPEAMRRAVDRLLAEAEVTGPPAPLERLGSFRDVQRVEALPMESAGRLIPLENGGYLIQVNAHELPARRRFSIAHEICHTFFDALRHATLPRDDPATGTFDTALGGAEAVEEYLCDVGAAHMLLHPEWLRHAARGRQPSLDALYEIAESFGASVEATALQLTLHDIWRCSLVYWEPGYRESERRLLETRAARGGSAATQPAPKLRAERIYAWSHAPFFPRRKSVNDATSIAQALHLQTRTSGRERFDFGDQVLEADCESDYTGYIDASGAAVHRVLTLLRWW